METVENILFRLRLRGIRVWVDRDKLHYQSNNGALTAEDTEALRIAKPAIISHLSRSSQSSASEFPIGRRDRYDAVPLSFPQQCLWNDAPSNETRYRIPCMLTRVSGDLDIDCLRRSMVELFSRHEALRSRIVARHGVLWVELDDPAALAFDIVDLRAASPDAREADVNYSVQSLLTRRRDPSIGPLFEASLFRLDDHEHVFASVVDHLVCDADSRVILLRDLWTIYDHYVRARPCSLPGIPAQSSDYAVWQFKSQSAWIRRHGEYWTQRLNGSVRLRVFPDEHLSEHGPPYLGVWRLGLESALTKLLRAFSQEKGVSLAVTVLSAYVALLSRWCNVLDIVVSFVVSDRSSRVELQHTVGSFVYPLFLRIQLADKDTFLDVMKRVVNEYIRAHKHSDGGRLAAQVPPMAFTRNPGVNWVPAELRISSSLDIDHSEVDGLGGMRLQSFELEALDQAVEVDVERDLEPSGIFFDSGENITGAIFYRRDRTATETIRRFVRNYEFLAECLVRRQTSLVKATTLLE